MQNIEKELSKVRPHIKLVNPVVARGIYGFGIFNILLGISLFFQQSRFEGNVVILNFLLDFQLWGFIFFALGCYMLYAYHSNKWEGMRRSQLIAVFFKSVWLAALFIRFISDYDNSVLLIIWAFIVYIQVLFYVFYSPPKVT